MNMRITVLCLLHVRAHGLAFAGTRGPRTSLFASSALQRSKVTLKAAGNGDDQGILSKAAEKVQDGFEATKDAVKSGFEKTKDVASSAYEKTKDFVTPDDDAVDKTKREA